MKETLIWVIFFYCVYSFCNDSIILYRSSHSLRFSIFLYVFTVLEYLFFSSILYSFLHNRLLRAFIITCSVAFVCFCIYSIIFGNFKKFDSYQASIESILIIAYCVFFFLEEINTPRIPIIYSSYKFWFIIGALMYLAATFFLFIYASDLPDKTREQYWVLNIFGNVLKNVLFSIAFAFYKPEKSSDRLRGTPLAF